MLAPVYSGMWSKSNHIAALLYKLRRAIQVDGLHSDPVSRSRQILQITLPRMQDCVRMCSRENVFAQVQNALMKQNDKKKEKKRKKNGLPLVLAHFTNLSKPAEPVHQHFGGLETGCIRFSAPKTCA